VDQLAVSTSVVADTDVFIAGAGPAGIACAIAVAVRGLSVQIADGMKPPIDKACGEGLMPDTLAALAELGIDVASAPSAPLHGIRFLGTPDMHSVSSFTEALFPAGQGRGIKRPVLHRLLYDRALQLGVRFHWETVVQGIDTAVSGQPQTIRTNRNPITARYIVGADGHQSRIRTGAGLDRASTSARRIGLRQHFAFAPWTSHVEVYWSDHGQAYVTPISPDEVCVAFVSRARHPSVAQALAHFPELQRRLASSTPSDAPRGSVTLSRKLHRVTRGNIALVGDASGSVDAVTGEGLSLCFRQSLALAAALQANDLSQYQRAHTAMHRLPHFMARSLLLMDRSPRLRDHALRICSRHPSLFGQLLALHIGHLPLRLFGAKGLLSNGLRLFAH
jgi:menaquinone-9 beta-reductase